MDTGIDCVLSLPKEKLIVFAKVVWLMEAVQICACIAGKSTNARNAEERAFVSTMINAAGAKNAIESRRADQVYANMAKKSIEVFVRSALSKQNIEWWWWWWRRRRWQWWWCRWWW